MIFTLNSDENSLAVFSKSSLFRRLRKLEAAFLKLYRMRIGLALAAMLLQSLLLLPLPMLQGWLDQKLPDILERLVRAELARALGEITPN